jgi:dolichol-phosphate mannosyltransferase
MPASHEAQCLQPKPVTTISVVAPAYNEAQNVPRLLERLEQVLRDSEDWELIVVDDGSTDDTLSVIRELAALMPKLRYLSLTRNFGHQTALKAGLDHARGDCVISLDADLQHPPEMIPEMIRHWRSGFEVVNMVRSDVNVPLSKRLTSRFFYGLTNAISDYRIEPGSSDFRLLDQRVVEALRGVEERNIFLRGLIPWLGFRQTNLVYAQEQRAGGTSKYGVTSMLRLALRGITSSSLRPLHIATFVGALMSLFAALYAIYALWIKFYAGTALQGWTSVLISVLLIGGIQLLMLGVLGEYLGRALTEVKGRPAYVLREHNLASSETRASVTRVVFTSAAKD